MENVPNWSTALPEPRVGAPLDPARVAYGNSVLAAPRFATLWHETVATFVTHTGPVLISAWVGFAAIVAAIQCLRVITGLTPVTDLWVFVAGAIAGLLIDALTQGALAWIGLHGSGASTSAASLAGAWRAAAAGRRGLLPGVLLHTVLTFVCALSLTPVLLSSGLMSLNLEPIEPSPDNLPQLAAARSLDAMALGVLHPFGEWIAPARATFLPMFLQTVRSDPDSLLAFYMMYHMDPSIRRTAQVYVAPMEELPAGLIALTGLAVLVAGEVMLRFYAAAAVRAGSPAVPVRADVFRAVLESARLGLHHARLVLGNAITLRVLARVLQIACIVLTTSAAETMVFPQLASSTGASWVAPAGRLACIAGSAAVSALLTAFCALYDARLYVALTRFRTGIPVSSTPSPQA